MIAISIPGEKVIITADYANINRVKLDKLLNELDNIRIQKTDRGVWQFVTQLVDEYGDENNYTITIRKGTKV